MKKFTLIIPLLFLFTGCTWGLKSVDLTAYHLKEKSTKQFLLAQKSIVAYSPKQKILKQFTYYQNENNILVQQIETLFPIQKNYVFSVGGLKYQYKLHSIGCDFQNVIKCIDNHLQTNT
ncbi:MAG: hypothetical protein U9N30_08005, partial [Campylobacterota bacterium]|nr:hypothetical protein [Campylobacterota bacterium]